MWLYIFVLQAARGGHGWAALTFTPHSVEHQTELRRRGGKLFFLLLFFLSSPLTEGGGAASSATQA